MVLLDDTAVLTHKAFLTHTLSKVSVAPAVVLGLRALIGTHRQLTMDSPPPLLTYGLVVLAHVLFSKVSAVYDLQPQIIYFMQPQL